MKTRRNIIRAERGGRKRRYIYAGGKRETISNGTELGREVREQAIIRWEEMERREAVSTQE